MPKQNRVTPFGEIVAVPAYGTLMGNRGVLHDAAGTIRRAWHLRRWIVCVLEFNGRKRTVMAPGRYTELFFLDEATALAAGHRPCFECQRQRFRAYRAAWTAGHALPHAPTAGGIDDTLHAERTGMNREKLCHSANLDSVPDGALVTLEGDDAIPYLLWRGELLAWSPAGYRERRTRPTGARVSVLTPAPTVTAIRAGYVPAVHPSARSAS
ncbi:hypothetical protein [Frigoriglobus tundricola]|uniref:Uncharacterized protein n=1 Tax=Frigoriglobus tundricola TaxID=2774151 RepID=A0A6M5YVU9_9BACT|nr:hypothetical protein [Frigoriglobus tundricola]QJW98227.1 hypothetical protein FTUN_5811 [Frigoriglobus tundricola]